MKIFISYDRSDRALVHLLSHILEADGKIECLYDRCLPGGENYELSLKNMIRKADLVLLLLTSSAAQSEWVNQEIGFALALGRQICPLAVNSEIEPPAFLSRIQAFPMYDWNEVAIKKFLAFLLECQTPEAKTHVQAIEGRRGRGRFLVDWFSGFLDTREDEIVVRHQAAFSVFAVSDDASYWEAGDYPEEYRKLLLQGRQLLDLLLEKERIFLKLILWPVRAYEPRFLKVRCDNLIAWMKGAADNDRIEYAIFDYKSPPNRYVFGTDFCLEGLKLHRTSGYRVSLVHYDTDRIRGAASTFDGLFRQAGGDKRAAITAIEGRCREVCGDAA